MDGINRKQMQDILVSQKDKDRAAIRVPTDSANTKKSAKVKGTHSMRINENPFFAKNRTKNRTAEKATKTQPSSLLWALVVVLFLVVLFALLSIFSSATIELVLRTETVALSNEFKVLSLKQATEGDLSFKFMSLTEEKSKEIPEAIEKNIQKKASGRVVIYNSYSAQSQKLASSTRFQSLDSKIFRINEPVVVPGTKMSGDRVVPGSVEVTIYADIPGKEYNIGLADFTIPGFKGGPRDGKFFARSSPNSSMSGGFSGTVKVPSDEDVAIAKTALRDEIKKIVIEKARAQIPSDYSFFPGSMVVKFEDVPQDLSEFSSSEVKVRATVYVFFFDTTLLTKKIASESIKDYKGEPVSISNMPALSFSFLGPVDNIVLSNINSIKFLINGDALFVWKIDTDKLIAEVVGKDKKELGKIIGTQGYFKKADATVRPIWKTTFPSNPAKISVKIINQ